MSLIYLLLCLAFLFLCFTRLWLLIPHERSKRDDGGILTLAPFSFSAVVMAFGLKGLGKEWECVYLRGGG